MERYTWQSTVDPTQQDRCTVDLSSPGLRAVGTQCTSTYLASWTLVVDESWVTERLHVDVAGHGWSRSLELQRLDDGHWTSSTLLSGTQPLDLAAPGLADSATVSALSAALDVDVGKCPLTNTMPIRRLDLLSGSMPRTPLVMAWVDMPSLQVIASDQYYSSVDESHVRYVSGTRGVDVVFDVSPSGIVTHYPGLATANL